MKFLRTHNATRFIQIFEAGERTVYRLWAPRWEDPTTLTVRTGRTRLVAAVRQWDPEVVSIELEGAPTQFTVCDAKGAGLARMTPALFEWLTLRRDLRMVNPEIDGAFGKWHAAHPFADSTEPPCNLTALSWQPLMSLVVPLWCTPLPYFHAMVDSVLTQTYPRWELVLVNASPEDAELARAVAACAAADERVRVVELPGNLGITGNTNTGIRASAGDYVGFLDHDDMLAPRALEWYAQTIDAHPLVDLLYCDEDSFHEDLSDCYAPRFKPDFNLDLLRSHNYLCHLLMVSRRALEDVELSPSRMSGAQDYDLSLKTAEVAREICHVPQLLYHWRAHAGSTNGGAVENKPYAVAASVHAIHEHLERRDIAVDEVVPTENIFVFSVHYHADDATVGVIAVFEDEHALLHMLEDLAKETEEHPLSIAAVGPLPSKSPTFAAPPHCRLALVPWDAPFDFAAMVNAGAAHLGHGVAGAPGILLVCRETVAFDRDRDLAIGQLAGCLMRPDVGIVAPKLFYPDGLVQHAGLYVLPDGTLGFLNQNFREGMGGGYLGLAECSCAYSAVGPDCFMLRRADLEAAGGLDERYGNALLTVADLCFKLRAAGKETVVLPEAQATNAAPVLWEKHDALAAYGRTDTLDAFWETWSDPRWRHDVLENPNTTMEHGYINLDTGRDIDAETRRVLLLRRLKGLTGRS